MLDSDLESIAFRVRIVLSISLQVVYISTVQRFETVQLSVVGITGDSFAEAIQRDFLRISVSDRGQGKGSRWLSKL